VFSRRFRGSCRNPDEVHGTLMARRQFPIRFSVGTDPDKKVCQLFREIGLLVRIRDSRYEQPACSSAQCSPRPTVHVADRQPGQQPRRRAQQGKGKVKSAPVVTICLSLSSE
jgi:hypothetical protein